MALLIFVLSAVAPEKMDNVLANIFKVLAHASCSNICLTMEGKIDSHWSQFQGEQGYISKI